MAVSGKWILQGTEGDIKAYLVASGLQADAVDQKIKDALMTTGPDGYVLEYVVNGDEVTRKVYFKGELKRENTGKVGQEAEGTMIDGRATKFTVTVSGNKLTRKDVCQGVTAESVFEVNGDTATRTMTAGGVTVVRKFSRA